MAILSYPASLHCSFQLFCLRGLNFSYLASLSYLAFYIAAASCTTTANETCVFPFVYEGVRYNGCTDANNYDIYDYDILWCATEVDPEGKMVDRKCGECEQDCPEDLAGCPN